MKIGIAGSGMIVRVIIDVWKAMGGIETPAIWCRPQSEARAQELARECGIGRVYTDYDEFLASDEFDLVYVGLLNSQHYEYARRALLAGKSVVCEKPLTSTGAQAAELLAIARERGLFLFESILPWYQRNYYATKERVCELGRIKLVQINFSQYSRRYERYLEGTVLPVFDPKLDGGCLADIMTYSIHYVMGIFGRPQDVAYFPNLGFNGIDLSGVLVMDYGDFKAVLSSAKDSSSTPFCIIQGDAGYIHMHQEPGKCQDIELHLRGQEPQTLDVEKCGEPFHHIWEKVVATVEAGDLEGCLAMTEQAVAVMDVMEAARKGAGITFPCDE